MNPIKGTQPPKIRLSKILEGSSEGSLMNKLSLTVSQTPAEVLATDEDFWQEVSNEFSSPKEFIQLEYGYYHPAFRSVIEKEIQAVQELNCRTSHYKRTEMATDFEGARLDLAEMSGVGIDEIVITRNATEALNILISGIKLLPGDEIVYSDYDYGSMVEALEQRAKREGLVIRKVSIPQNPLSDEEVINCYTAATTSRTRLWHVTHVVHFTGHILPVSRICEKAHQLGIEVVVDAAHSFAQIPFTIRELGCDYLGASLHKWLGAPLGLGLLFVKREKIENVWPLFGDTGFPQDDIRKFQHLGNCPDSAHLGLREAIRWHNTLGTEAKFARLRFLQQRWTDAARDMPGVRVITPQDPNRSGAIASFVIDGVPPREITEYLMNEHRIFIASFENSMLQCIRVTPGLPTLKVDIDFFIEALKRSIVYFK